MTKAYHKIFPLRMDPIFTVDDERHYLGNLLADDDEDDFIPDPVEPSPSKLELVSPPTPSRRVFTKDQPSKSFNVLEGLRKIAEGSGSSLTKAEVNKLVEIVSDLRTRTIFNDVPVNLDNFPKFVDSHPDIAAEFLLYILKENSTKVDLYLEILMSLGLSVQTMITVHRFISRCEETNCTVPNEFLHNFISHCMTFCEQIKDDKSLVYRFVRMISHFFILLLRLKGFDAKRRIPEMQSFATSFSFVKEAVVLYQTTLQIK